MAVEEEAIARGPVGAWLEERIPSAEPPFDFQAIHGGLSNLTFLVTDADGRPIAGLYAVGNDMQSVMGGVYPGPGITVGPGLVFAWLAARHALGALSGSQALSPGSSAPGAAPSRR